MKAVIDYLKANGYTTIDPSYYENIRLWALWYRGRVPSIHNYIQFNGKQRIRRCRKSLGMAKKIAEDWANLLLNEKVVITASDEAVNEVCADELARNKFALYGNQLIEKAFALGTGAFVEYFDNGVVIDYVTANCIYPLTWDNGDVTECAFASERKEGKDKYLYLNIHRLNDRGTYVIENHMLRVDKTTVKEVDLPEDVAEIVETNSTVPRFQLLYPNIANNIDMDSPLGISVYANALDQLEACDVLFDSFFNEFNLGRKRIMIPLSMARIMLENEDGSVIPVFDENDLTFYAYQTDDKTQRIEEMNGDLRIDAHVAGLDKAVNLAAYKCGFGEHKYKFDGAGVKTATEVISEESDMFRSVRKHEAVLKMAIEGLYKALADMNGLTTDFDINIDFDDSIIDDSAAERERDRVDVNDGLMTKVEYRMKWFGETAEQAEAALSGIQDSDVIMFG